MVDWFMAWIAGDNRFKWFNGFDGFKRFNGGWCGAKNNEAPRSFNSASRRCHFERSREISMAERSLPDVRQHQDIVFPWRIHADSRRAVEIEGCARDDDTKGWLSPRPSGIAPFIRRRSRHHNPEP